MKKLFIVLITLFTVLNLVGCAASKPEETATTTTTTEASDKPVKAVLVVRTALGDKSFYDSAWRGLNKAKDELGMEVRAVEIGGDQSKYQPTLTEVSEADEDVVFVNSGALSEVALELMGNYPEKKYVLYDMQPTFENTFDNAVAISFKQSESSFLGGIVAAKMAKNGVIGFIGGSENIIINDFMVGYIAGAKYANPDIKIHISLIGDFKDTAKGKELALVQLANGAEVIHSVAGAAGLGCLDAVKEKGAWSIGVDSDQAMALKETSPETSERILTSALKNVDFALFSVLQQYKDGTLEFGTTNAYGIKEKAAGIAKNEYYEKNVPDDVKKLVEEAEAKIISGEIKVPTSFTMTQDEITELKNSVKP